MGAEPRLFRRLDAILVESIFWDDRSDELVWVDITRGTMHRARLDDPHDGSRDTVMRLPAPVSAVQPAASGGFVAALKDRVVLLDAGGTIRRTVALLPHAHAGIRSNEAKVDPFGRFVVGAMNVTTGAPDAGLYLVEPTGSVRVLRGGFGVANGFEWSDDGQTMYVTDTATRTVYRGAYSPDPEALGELTPFLTGEDSDGLALDTDGRFWNGVYGAGQVVRWTPDGRIEARIPIPAPQVTSVAFGGPARNLLFVGTAREQLTEQQLVAAPLSGSIFVVDTDAEGRPAHTFGPIPSDGE